MKWVLGALLALALVPAPATAAPATTGMLYVQQAANATLTRSGGAWKLVLDRPDPHVIAFADRPVRTGTAIRAARFVRDWPAAFGGDPPNAALEIEGAPASRDVALLELSAPRLSRDGRRLTYRARPLTATSATLGGLAARADRGISGRLGRVTLFIDDGGGGQRGLRSATVTGIAPGTDALLEGARLAAGAPVSFTPTTAGATWTETNVGPQISCAASAPAPCAGILVGTIDPSIAAPGQPLGFLLFIDSVTSVTLSWSGGAPRTFTGGQYVTLQPGS